MSVYVDFVHMIGIQVKNLKNHNLEESDFWDMIDQLEDKGDAEDFIWVMPEYYCAYTDMYVGFEFDVQQQTVWPSKIADLGQIAINLKREIDLFNKFFPGEEPGLICTERYT